MILDDVIWLDIMEYFYNFIIYQVKLERWTFKCKVSLCYIDKFYLEKGGSGGFVEGIGEKEKKRRQREIERVFFKFVFQNLFGIWRFYVSVE